MCNLFLQTNFHILPTYIHMYIVLITYTFTNKLSYHTQRIAFFYVRFDGLELRFGWNWGLFTHLKIFNILRSMYYIMPSASKDFTLWLFHAVYYFMGKLWRSSHYSWYFKIFFAGMLLLFSLFWGIKFFLYFANNEIFSVMP